MLSLTIHCLELINGCLEDNNHQSIFWKHPPCDHFKLNCDGSKSGSIAAAGGLLRDHMGNVILSFSTNIGNCFVISAELWAFLIGVKIA